MLIKKSVFIKFPAVIFVVITVCLNNCFFLKLESEYTCIQPHNPKEALNYAMQTIKCSDFWSWTFSVI